MPSSFAETLLGKCFLAADAANTGEQINSGWSTSERFQAWIAPNIKIACLTRSPMQGETVCTYDDVINAAGVE
jgi:hypothetical protein